MKADQYRSLHTPFTTWWASSPQVVVSSLVQIGRGAISIVVSMSAILRLLEILPAAPAEATRGAILLVLVLLVLLFITALLTAYMLFGPLRADRMPSPWLLTLSAVFDHLWVVLGWVTTDYAMLPFPALLVVTIGIHGLLLGPLRTGILTLVAALFFGFAYHMVSPVVPGYFTNESFLALFVGVAVLSAIVGNRIRAANWAIEQFRAAIAHMQEDQGQLFEQLPVGLAFFGPGPTVVRTNSRALALGPGQQEEVMSWLAVEIPDAAAAVERALDGEIHEQNGESRSPSGRYYTWQVARATDPDLSTFPTTALTAPLAAGERNRVVEIGGRVLALLTLRDVTDHRQAEEVRRRADHFEQVAELSAGLAHELRNPLAALRSAAEQLAETSWTDPVDARLARVVVREADRLDRLVSDFLDFARVGQGKVAHHTLHRLVDDAVQVAVPMAAEREVKVNLNVDDAEILTDADLVFRVLSNLLLNAVVFAPSHSTIDVEARMVGREAVFKVRDRGPGVAPEEHSRIFRPFVTSRPNGTGLGLAIAARAATLLGGCVAVGEPEDGGPGALFTLSIPSQSVVPQP